MSSFFRRFFSGISTYSTANMGAAKTTALEQIQNNKVVVYSKTYCPHCTHVKKVFNELLGPDNYLTYELDAQPDGDDIHNVLKNEFNPEDLEKDGIIMKNDGPDENGKIKWQRNHTTVPNVWIGKEQVGGRTDVEAALGNGSLKKKLQAAGAL